MDDPIEEWYRQFSEPDLSQELPARFPAKPRVRKLSMEAAMFALRERLDALRKRGWRYRDIRKFFATHGIKVSPSTLRLALGSAARYRVRWCAGRGPEQEQLVQKVALIVAEMERAKPPLRATVKEIVRHFHPWIRRMLQAKVPREVIAAQLTRELGKELAPSTLAPMLSRVAPLRRKRRKNGEGA